MGKRTNLYKLCLVLFPVAFAGFVIGFGCPVWQVMNLEVFEVNSGLWQLCHKVVNNCTTLKFNQEGDWGIGVRAVEIFALLMLVLAAVDIAYENCFSHFGQRRLVERVTPGFLSITGGLGGITGVIVFAVKTHDLTDIPGTTFTYGWALALLAAGSGLAVVVGVGFCVSGFFMETSDTHRRKTGVNGHTPYVTSNDENYQLSAYTNRGYQDEHHTRAPVDNLPGYAAYNGVVNAPAGYRHSLPPGPSTAKVLPPFSPQPKSAQYYSFSDDRYLDPNFDLSEGFQPRSSPRTNYDRSDPYSRASSRLEDPYSRTRRDPNTLAPPRAGYNDPYGFDRRPQSDDRSRNRLSDLSQDSFYRAGRF